MKATIPKDRLNVLADVDSLVYTSGFAADTQAKERFGVEHYLEENYVHWAIGNINGAIEKILDTFCSALWHRFFIAGTGNYRDTIATTIPRVLNLGDGKVWKYKGNRNPLHRPKYYAEIREHLVAHWGAEKVDGRESDDEVSILQWGNPDRSTCIVGIDKDLDNTPGWHYNPKKQEFRYITLKEADLNFKAQCLAGDWGSDYIPGLTGIADKTARKILKECNYDHKEIDRVTLSKYRSEFGPQYGEAVLNDCRHLLWLQREPWIGWNKEPINCQWSNK